MHATDFLGATWRKSSRSNGTGACVEIAWRKSSRSNGGGNCVELALSAEVGAVRDSKNPDGPMLTFPAASLAAFLAQR
ncbi:hypothetical protein JOF56_006003 [Kibdelosporangium banguiense]|uniref:DUF397 domain-containing protein n=1 Tax=Kibdelosporangium banguiense TaxID=1365924 RepID=A0ABS4TMI5_9PSEU|nr:DUF397 domain-containing protein [Kibdelosporangium banguiense]MBP2325618.1 hypothetical protein [Kibdelosporangium banguiense]